MKNNLLIICVTLLVWSCAPKVVMVDKPDAQMQVKSYEHELSSFDIPIEVSIPDVEKTLNSEFKGVLYRDDSFSDNDDDGLKYTVSKLHKISLSVQGNSLIYTLPLRIDATVRKVIFGNEIQKSTRVDGIMQFKTNFELSSDWKFDSKTSLENFEVLNDPIIKFGFLEFSVKGLLHRTIKSNKKYILNLIDEEIEAYFPKREKIEEIWADLQEPHLVSEEYSSWLVLNPKSVRVSPITGSADKLSIKLGLDAFLDIVVGEKPNVDINSNLPALELGGSGAGLFKVAIGTQIDYTKATEVLRNNFVGYEYEYKKNKEVVVEDIDVYGNGDELVVGMQLSGDIVGKIYMTGTPKYDKAEDKIFVDNFEFDAKSRNALLNVAEMMVKGPFKKKVEQYMTFSIREELEETEQLINASLKESSFDEKLQFKCDIISIEPKEILLNDNGMQVLLVIVGQSQMNYGPKELEK